MVVGFWALGLLDFGIWGFVVLRAVKRLSSSCCRVSCILGFEGSRPSSFKARAGFVCRAGKALVPKVENRAGPYALNPEP